MPDPDANQQQDGDSAENRDRYFLAFGKFIHEFASVETIFHVLFRRMSGMEYPAAHIISGAMGLEQLRTATRNIVRARKLDAAVIAEVDAVCEHLIKIMQLRNFLVHRGARPEGETFTATDQFTSKFADSYKILQFRMEDILAATRDCTVLFMRIYRIWHPIPPGDDDPFALQVIREPWHYQHREPLKVEG